MLSDVIGPPSNPPEDAIPASRAISATPSNFQSTAHGSTSLPSESDPPESTTSIVADLETGQGASSRADPSSILEPDSEATLVDPIGYLIESLSPEAHGEVVAEFLPVPDDEESADGDTTSYFVEAAEMYVIGSEAEEESDDDENIDDCGEDDHTVMMSNRQSTFSSFTGASLLASPRHSIFGESSVASPIKDGDVDLLSPVQLSARLRPFSIPSLGSKVKRGDSIDSGYADGDSWASPLPFPRSPPRSFQSPATFPSHSRRASLSSPALKARRVSYDVGALRPFPHNPIEIIKEESDGSSEDNEDTAYTILGAYDTSPSEGQGEGRACDPLQVTVAEEKAEEDDKPSEVPAVMRSPRRYPPEHLHPTREYDLDSCNQSSFISEDNLSFITALSTQPSYEDLSDTSRISPVKQDSLLSSISGCSTPNTSTHSHHGDANELLEQPTVGSHVCESYRVATTGMGSQNDSTEAPEARASEECPLPEEVATNSNVLFASPSADDLQGPAPEKAVAPRGSLSGVFRLDRRSNPSVDTSHGPSLANLGANDFAPEKVVTPRERLSGAFHFNKQPPKSSPSSKLSDSPPSVKDAFSSAPLGADDHQESRPENVAAPRKRLPGISRHDRRSPKSSLSVENIHGSSSIKNVLGYASLGSGGAQEFVSENVAAPQEFSPCVLHFDRPSPKSSSSADNSHSLSTVKDLLGHAPPDADGSDRRSPESSSTGLHGCLAECAAAEAGQSPLVENSLRSDKITESFGLESDNFTERLPFPLPSPFPPAETVGHSTLSGEADRSILSETAFATLKKDVSSAYTVSQEEEMQRIHSGSDLTEKARPSQLPPVGPLDSDTDFTLRRSRAASDLTVKGRSPPVTTPVDTPDILRSPSPGRSDPVQSLFDQYFDDGTSDDGSEFSNPAHKDTALPDVSGPMDDPSREVHLRSMYLTLHTLQGVSSPSSDGKPGNAGADSPRSETVLRPLLTGRRSVLRSSPAELIPKANLANDKGPSPTHPSTRLQAREIGSTMVPLGFRRHKPQVCAQIY